MELQTKSTFDDLFESTKEELIAQQISNNGAIHALEQLKIIGVTDANVDALLTSLKQSLDVIQHCADSKDARLEIENGFSAK